MVGKFIITTIVWLIKMFRSLARVKSHLFVEEPEQKSKGVERGRKGKEQREGGGKERKGGKFKQGGRKGREEKER